MKSLITTFFISLCFTLLGQASFLGWARQMGGDNMDYGSALVVDAAGNVYSTGYFLYR